MSLSKSNQLDLTIIIPAYSEEKRIGKSLDELAMYLKTNNFIKNKNIEVLVVAANTTDDTHEIVNSKERLFKKLELLKPGDVIGKGRDVQYGMLRANGNLVMFMDADLATPLAHIEEFYKLCDGDFDIVIGTRDLKTYRHNPFKNKFAVFGNNLYQLAGGLKVEDTQCGFKMFKHSAARLCFTKLKIMGWSFDLEILAIAKTNYLSICPIRINDWLDQPFSTYYEGPFTITKRTVLDFIRVSVNTIRGKYKANKQSV